MKNTHTKISFSNPHTQTQICTNTCTHTKNQTKTYISEQEQKFFQNKQHTHPQEGNGKEGNTNLCTENTNIKKSHVNIHENTQKTPCVPPHRETENTQEINMTNEISSISILHAQQNQGAPKAMGPGHETKREAHDITTDNKNEEKEQKKQENETHTLKTEKEVNKRKNQTKAAQRC